MTNSNYPSTILVAGATGILGSEICRRLRQNNQEVKGLVRKSSDNGKVALLKELGVEIVIGDLKDNESLSNALKGVSIVISTASSTLSRQPGDSINSVDEKGQINLIDAAVAAGVKQFVYISFNHIPVEFPLQDAKRKVEKHLAASGLRYTILQPTCFMEIWLGPALGFDYANATATIYGQGKNRMSWISLNDVAAFAVAVLGNPAAENKSFELGGPEALSPLEVVSIFESAKGKRFQLQFVPEDALNAQRQTAPDPLSESFAALTIGVANGSEINMTKTLDLFPLRLTTVKDYAEVVSQPG